MPKFYRNKLKYFVDERFFNRWDRAMAYVLGFTYADGNIYKSTLSWDLQTRDNDILRKIKKALLSNYPIKFRSSSVRLRISNQKLILKAIERGLLPKKNMRKVLPQIPSYLIRHFVRGYLEGDGWIVIRSGKDEGDIGFVSGNKSFLQDLNITIKNSLGIQANRVRPKQKITPRGIYSQTYLLEYYSSNAHKIASWLYENLNENDLYLNRKYKKYLKLKKLYDFLQSGSRKVRVIQKIYSSSIEKILRKMYERQHMDGVVRKVAKAIVEGKGQAFHITPENVKEFLPQ